jgi:hypothetical protein
MDTLKQKKLVRLLCNTHTHTHVFIMLTQTFHAHVHTEIINGLKQQFQIHRKLQHLLIHLCVPCLCIKECYIPI